MRRARRLAELHGWERGADFVRVLKVLRPGSAEKGAIGALRKSFERLREDVVKPALARWGEYAAPDVMALLVDARDRYAEWRRREGRMNFQDLLIYSRNLLRDHAGVRTSLRERFTPVLVDEFQDTDPIQAEILFYLTGSEADETDWKKLVPQPGSLFVVGDPKQSIYRFRRADIETYDIRAVAHRELRARPRALDELPLDGWILRLGQPRLLAARILPEGGNAPAGGLCPALSGASGSGIPPDGLSARNALVGKRRAAGRGPGLRAHRGLHRRGDRGRREEA